jgi:exodeoxyribonuclease VII small subunit
MLRPKREEAMSETSPPDIESLSFEQALAELESIVQQLESGEVELEKSIAIYERGAALRAHCEGKLKNAELKVERIVRGEDGEPATEPAGLD